jgi:hypothetical protein
MTLPKEIRALEEHAAALAKKVANNGELVLTFPSEKKALEFRHLWYKVRDRMYKVPPSWMTKEGFEEFKKNASGVKAVVEVVEEGQGRLSFISLKKSIPELEELEKKLAKELEELRSGGASVDEELKKAEERLAASFGGIVTVQNPYPGRNRG